MSLSAPQLSLTHIYGAACHKDLCWDPVLKGVCLALVTGYDSQTGDAFSLCIYDLLVLTNCNARQQVIKNELL